MDDLDTQLQMVHNRMTEIENKLVSNWYTNVALMLFTLAFVLWFEFIVLVW
jgi:hypothetical protein